MTDQPARKNIIVVDLSVSQTSPAGSCVLSELVELSKLYTVHLISSEADETVKKYAILHHISAPKKPLLLWYMVFSSKVKSKIEKLRRELGPITIIQTTQGQFIKSTISYPHFCHKAYLNTYWKLTHTKGIQRVLRKWNHLYQARMEKMTFYNSKVVVAPSHGLKRELISFYPELEKKIRVVANPVETAHFKKPHSFDRSDFRAGLNVYEKEIVVAFVALGDFARKGLLKLFQSLQQKSIQNIPIKIIVIGGNPKEIRTYKGKGVEMGLAEKIRFVGFQKDIRPFLWASDIFALPSLYEVFPLACIQAAAAGLPLLVSRLHGVEEYLVDEGNGWLVERNEIAIAKVLKKIVGHEYNLEEMGACAQNSIEKYNHGSFRIKWREIYASLDQSLKPKVV